MCFVSIKSLMLCDNVMRLDSVVESATSVVEYGISYAGVFLRLFQIISFPPSFELQSWLCWLRHFIASGMFYECHMHFKMPGRINQSVRNCIST